MRRFFIPAVCAVLLLALLADAQQSGWFRQFGTSNDDQARAVVAVGPAVYVTG